MSFLGFLFVALSGAAAGFSASGEIRRAYCHTEESIRLTERMRFFVCVLHLSLPESVKRLGSEFPILSGSIQGFEVRMREIGFTTLWRSVLQESGLSGVPAGILVRIGEDISEGEAPERAFSNGLSELDDYKDYCLDRLKKSAKLYPFIGLSAGCFLGILLL